MKKTIVTILAMSLAIGAFAQDPQQENVHDTPFYPGQTVRAFSHRGGRLERDENTAYAFQKSWEAGFTGFETDIRMTKDGVLYLTHDSTLERTTNGTGVFEEKTSKEIDQLLTKKGNKVMKFEDFCKWLDGKDNLYVEFEFKTKPENLYPTEKLEKYAETIYQRVMKIKSKNSQFIFTSSDYRGLRYLQMNHPDAKLLLISSKPICEETIALAKTTGIMTLGCTTKGTSREAVEKAKKEGITVSLWPSQSVDDFVRACMLGADRLCIDTPLNVKKEVEEKFPWLKVIW